VIRPIVSIITVTMNRFHYLIEAAKSVQGQSYRALEWLILDESDSSGITATREYLEKVLKDERIRYFPVSLDKSKCPFTTRRNELLDMSKGKYFLVLNDDDYFLPEKLERMVHIGETSKADMICCSVGIVSNPNVNAPMNAVQKAEPNRLSIKAIREQNPLDIGSFLFRRETYENTYGLFNERLSTAEDWDILFRSAVMGANITTLPDVLHLYRQHALQTIHRVKNEPAFGRLHENDLNSIRTFEQPVIFAYLPSNPLTTSQKFVCDPIIEEGWKEPLKMFGNHENEIGEKDLLLCLAPFLYSPLDILTIKSFPGIKIAIQMEDPWALNTNKNNALHYDFIYTNDDSGIGYYDGTIPGILPTNSISMKHIENAMNREKEYDLILVGYAYPSRQREIESLMPIFDRHKLKVLLVGEGWSKYSSRNILVLHSVKSEYLIALLNKGKYTLCLEREINDVPGCYAGLSPNIPSRGYIEYASTSKTVFKRHQRDINRFGHPLTYSSTKEFEDILTHESEQNTPDWRAWTYRNRIGQIIARWIAGRKCGEIP
jgi:glycosyltransferase involved in cell wall biosynthesis